MSTPSMPSADTVKDLDVIDQAKQKGQVDEDQSKGMSEDVVRKKQGTTKPMPSTTPKKGKRKYRLTLMLQDRNGKALDGTWVINYGSLRDETFETTTSSSVKTFDVELDPSIDNVLQFKGTPYLANASFPPGSEYYYHYVNLSPELGTNRNLTFTISQRRRKKQVTASETASTAEITTKAVAEESGTQSEVTIESGGIEELLLGKIAGKAIFFGKVTDTNTSGTTTTTSDTDTETYAVDILASRLATKQKGQPSGDLDVED